jgi:hypothetical protein
MSSVTFVDGIKLTVETCWVCGTVFAMATPYANWARDNGKGFYCPKGDHLGYGEGTVQKLEKQLAKEKHLREQETARLRDAVTHVQNERSCVEASLRSTKGVVTKLKKRVAAGVCPCCTRSFANLGRHMKSKHPDFVNE